jgi:hypothetical protein
MFCFLVTWSRPRVDLEGEVWRFGAISKYHIFYIYIYIHIYIYIYKDMLDRIARQRRASGPQGLGEYAEGPHPGPKTLRAQGGQTA